jgi:hypothetical protein
MYAASCSSNNVFEKNCIYQQLQKAAASFCCNIFAARISAMLIKAWGRCYDHNFLRFLLLFGEKMAFFSKNNAMTIFSKVAVV